MTTIATSRSVCRFQVGVGNAASESSKVSAGSPFPCRAGGCITAPSAGRPASVRRATGARRSYAGFVEEDPSRAAGDHDRLEANSAAEDRDRIAEDRDRRADAHDRVSEARDSRADARDERAEARGRVVGGDESGAAADRGGAKRDREGGASDRTQAADDRSAASADRGFSARERVAFAIDELTGAHRREVGFVELERDLTRAQRTGQPFTLAFIDIDDLKAGTIRLATTLETSFCARQLTRSERMFGLMT